MISYRNRIAQSMMTLPIAVVISIGAWLLADINNWTHWTGWAITILTTYALMECNNYFQLLRIRSRMTSTTYLMLASATVGFHDFSAQMLIPLCVVCSLFLLFRTYQQPKVEGQTFYAFLILGAGSLVFAPLVLLLLPLWYIMGAYMRTLSLRTMLASILGLVCPYWLLLAAGTLDLHIWQYITGEIPAQYRAFFAPEIWNIYYVEPDVFVTNHLDALVTLALLLILTILTTLHYRRTDYLDKIRTRMYLHTFRLLQVFFVAFVGVWPEYFYTTGHLLMITTAVFASHYFALAKGRWADAFFALTIVLFGANFIYHICL